MKAMIFAAGLGTRLRPLTDNCPKALVKVAGRPMLWHVIMRLKHVGVREIVINVHHLAPLIIEYLKSNGNFGLDIHISDESQLLLDTGGGILNARKWLDGDEPFIVHNADIFTDLNLADLVERHLSTSADVTLAVSNRKSSRTLYFCNDSNRLCGWKNHKTAEVCPSGFVVDDALNHSAAFSGIHIASPVIFDTLSRYSESRMFPIIPYYLSVCSSMNIQGYESPVPYEWYDIGKPVTLEQARHSKMILKYIG